MSARATVLCFAQLWLASQAFGQAADKVATRAPSAVRDEPLAENEREFIGAAPFELPGPCRPELQASIRLSGTVYDTRHPERSLAIMGAPSTHRMAVYRCGSRWGDLQILAVRPRAVLLSTESDAPCWLPMTRPNNPAPPARPTPPPRARTHRSRTAFSSDELEQSIQRIQPGVYRVDRTLLDRAFARAAQIARTTRTRTVEAHGSPVGIALTRIPSGGLLEHLGMKRGDLLKTVNGFQIASIDGMLKARTQLAPASRLSVALVRDGKPMTIEYRLR
jgi:hypothetical protein